jgi:hypothetical protein
MLSRRLNAMHRFLEGVDGSQLNVAFAYRAGIGRAGFYRGGVYRDGAYRAGVYRGAAVRRGVAVGVSAAAVGAAVAGT